ncbi:MAG: hypothetical protein NVSMB26_15200 [Beijerinckiaceae bacterium]
MIARLVCALALSSTCSFAALAASKSPTAKFDELIAEHAQANGLPESLVHRVVLRESRYNARAFHSRYFGLMQITYATARSMGYKGKPAGLLDPDVNLTYAVPYLANAYLIAGRDEDRAVHLYAAGYYPAAKKARLLSKLRTAESPPVKPVATSAEPAPPPSLFATLFGAAPALPSSEFVASAACSSADSSCGDFAEPVPAGVPLPPRRPARL